MDAGTVFGIIVLTMFGTATLFIASIAIREWWKEKWAPIREMRQDMYGHYIGFGRDEDGPNGMNVYKLHRRVTAIEHWLKSEESAPFRAFDDPEPEDDED